MITVPLHDFIFLPLALALVILFVGSLYYTARAAAGFPRTGRSRIYRCVTCEHVYVTGRDVPLARCPRCGTMNEALRR